MKPNYCNKDTKIVQPMEMQYIIFSTTHLSDKPFATDVIQQKYVGSSLNPKEVIIQEGISIYIKMLVLCPCHCLALVYGARHFITMQAPPMGFT